MRLSHWGFSEISHCLLNLPWMFLVPRDMLSHLSHMLIPQHGPITEPFFALDSTQTQQLPKSSKIWAGALVYCFHSDTISDTTAASRAAMWVTINHHASFGWYRSSMGQIEWGYGRDRPASSKSLRLALISEISPGCCIASDSLS